MDALAPALEPGWHPHLWHPFTQVATADPPPRVRRALGARLDLEDGRQLIDAISSWWVTLHGHAEPRLAAAIAAQAQELEQVIFANFSHGPAETLASSLAQRTGLDRLFFSDNGSTAVEVALKIAWQWWRNQEGSGRGDAARRRQLIAFDGAYHGDTFGAMALGERSLFTAPFEPLMFAVARAPWPATWWGDPQVEQREAAALECLEQLLEVPTAAVILEPMLQGAGGMAMVRAPFLREVAARVRRAGALLIADEVMTGFGRTGKLFASLHADLRPDLMALSKGLTGGFLPMGVTMASEELFEGFRSGAAADVAPAGASAAPRTFFHGHSFTANPLGCAVANASLELLEDQPERFEGFEARHKPHLEVLARHPLVRKPRLLGCVAAFDLAVERPGYLNPAGKVLQRLVAERGVFLRPLGQVVYLLPPLCLSDAELEQCYWALQQALDAL